MLFESKVIEGVDLEKINISIFGLEINLLNITSLKQKQVIVIVYILFKLNLVLN